MCHKLDLLLVIIFILGATGGTPATQVPRDKKQEKAQEDLSKQLQNTKRFVCLTRILGKMWDNFLDKTLPNLNPSEP